MFFEISVEEKLAIALCEASLLDTSECKLIEQYAGKIFGNMDIGIITLNKPHILSIQIEDGQYICHLKVQLLICRFIVGEIMEGLIYKQSEDGVFIALPYFDNIFINLLSMPNGCDKAYAVNKNLNKRGVVWFWEYDKSKLYFRTDKPIRFRVQRIDAALDIVYANINETGLGPVDWWL